MMIAQAFFGHDRIWSIAIFTMALTINGAVTAGYLGNGLDIAPKFSGEQNEYLYKYKYTSRAVKPLGL